jgi:chromosome segregation ATPase
MQAVRSKMATLKAKLEEADRQAKEAEDELAGVNTKADEQEALAVELNEELSKVEDDLDAAESKHHELTSNVGEAEKSTDEHDQAKKILENRGSSDAGRLSRLESDVAEITSEIAELEEKFESCSLEVAEAEEQLDQEEERCETADARVKSLEVEVTQVGNSLRSMQINEDQANERTMSGDTAIGDKDGNRGLMEERAIAAEERVKGLEDEYDKLDAELADAKEKYIKENEELNSVLAEINEM